MVPLWNHLTSMNDHRDQSPRLAFGVCFSNSPRPASASTLSAWVPDCSKPTLQGIIRGRVDPRTVINSDGWRGYHGLVDLGYGHVRVADDVFTETLDGKWRVCSAVGHIDI